MLMLLIAPIAAMTSMSSGDPSPDANSMLYLVGAIYILVEAIKFLVGKVGGKNDKYSDRDRHMIQEMYDLHKKTDDEGRPLWYTPTGLHQTLEKIMEILRHIVDAQKENARYQKDSAKILERLLDRLDRIEKDAARHKREE